MTYDKEDLDNDAKYLCGRHWDDVSEARTFILNIIRQTKDMEDHDYDALFKGEEE